MRERDRSLERALLFNFAIHLIAMMAMGALLLPTLPGGSAASDASRIAAIAEHPWRFRLGWLPWQLCAVADLWLAIAMVRVRWLPRLPAVLVLLFTIAAVIPDQWAQAVWVTQGVALAQSGDAGRYLALEREIFPLTAGLGALLYTVAALGWTWCFAKAGTWSRALTALSVPLWATMAVAVVGPLLPEGARPSPAFVSIANGLGFMQLQVWLGLVTEEVLRRARPHEGHGRLAVWRHPSPGLVPRLADAFANSRLASAFFEPLPEAEMRSDITNVVYVNYLVSSEVARSLVPEGLELQTIGPEGRYALFSFLTFQHGNFGFRFMGPLRRLMPSPVQTNWRVHVVDPRTKHHGIYFVTNAVSNTMQALAARLTTEGMPMHVLGAGSKISRREDGGIRVELDPGVGSAPDAVIDLRPAAGDPELTGPWKECWSSFRDFLAYCVPQDRAMSSQPLRRRISRQEIDLGIHVEECEPLVGTVVSRAAKAIVGDAEPICFRVPAVHFRFTVEAHDHH
ncbi:MAG: DUF2071 domain-containing protein [Deltaproteobacteria bacterium]|nr:DUF2071 domain-containing protein [Deltaproteobacteria bacterium]